MKQDRVGSLIGRLRREMLGGDGVSIEEGRRVLIRRCRCIEDYGERLVRVRVSEGCVAVIGSELTMRSFRGDLILVEGLVERVELERGGEVRA